MSLRQAPGKIALVTPDGKAREVANDCARIRGGGDVLERIDLGRPCFAAMLGGPDRRTLFMLTANWRGTEGVGDVIEARTGQVLVAAAPAAGVGWP